MPSTSSTADDTFSFYRWSSHPRHLQSTDDPSQSTSDYRWSPSISSAQINAFTIKYIWQCYWLH